MGFYTVYSLSAFCSGDLAKVHNKIKILLLSYIVSFKDDLFDFALSCASSYFSVCLFLFIDQFRIME